MSAWGLSEWGDRANIVLAAISVFTAFVTACMLLNSTSYNESNLMLNN